MSTPLHDWEPWSVEQAVALFDGALFRWWISGGRALQLHLGHSWRRHGDLDIGVRRAETTAVYRWLVDWDMCIAARGRLRQWDGSRLDAGRSQNNVWARTSPNSPWRFDLTVGSGTERSWVYRRDESVTRRWDEAVQRSTSGVPYLAPDLQLLFKSKDPRPKDDLDARRVIPTLDAAGRRFLTDRLPPDHPWRQLLRTDRSSAESAARSDRREE